MNSIRRTVAGLAASVLMIAFTPGIASAEVIEVAEEFEFTGAPQSWVPPAGVTEATFMLFGASGGAGSGVAFSPNPPGGKGARLVATLPVQPGVDYFLYVGGAAPGIGREAGGYNGGGGGSHLGNVFNLGGGGGGASDVRTSASLADRLLVAGGGGGGGSNGAGSGPSSSGGVSGGAGGDSGSAGDNGLDEVGGVGRAGGGGSPGTALVGGAGGFGGSGDSPGQPGKPGGLGIGGSISSSTVASVGGGGGGGYYGGGSGGGGGESFETFNSGSGGGGGGGSSFAAPQATGVELTDGANDGHGRIVVVYERPVEPTVQILSGPSGTVTGPVTFAFESQQADSSFQCRIDNGDFIDCSSPVTFAGLAPGAHVFEVIANSPEGMRSEPASRTFSIAQPPMPPDEEPPAVDHAPRIAKLAVLPRRVTPNGRAGKRRPRPALVRIRLSEDARVRFRLRRNPALPRNLWRESVFAIQRDLSKGANTVRLRQMMRRRLKPGRYFVEAIATDSAGQRSKRRLAAFKVMGS